MPDPAGDLRREPRDTWVPPRPGAWFMTALAGEEVR
ncbi:hypothetical protein LILAB_32710 [Corallococcus macrosporus]|uniref:Uncharacterized protein n=1 Tax=Myxococcus fulvus (strain ATCC BAA-855 / HW-1) TaxID=483219 RepID=F8CC89_MYXFH|nr:hypothetical protein LILAB_32710 [Corallococcus macrosporus]